VAPVLKTQLDNAYDFPAIPEWPEILEKVGAEIHAGWAGQYPLAKALDRANELVTQLLTERKYPVERGRGRNCPGSERFRSVRCSGLEGLDVRAQGALPCPRSVSAPRATMYRTGSRGHSAT